MLIIEWVSCSASSVFYFWKDIHLFADISIFRSILVSTWWICQHTFSHSKNPWYRMVGCDACTVWNWRCGLRRTTFLGQITICYRMSPSGTLRTTQTTTCSWGASASSPIGNTLVTSGCTSGPPFALCKQKIMSTAGLWI